MARTRSKYIDVPSIWRRLLSFILDIILVQILISPLDKVLTGYNPTDLLTLNTESISADIIIVGAIASILYWAYFTLCEYYLGATIGMRLFRLRMSGPATLANCLIRHAYFIPIFPFSLLWIAEPLFIIFKQRRLLEILSKTGTVQEVVMPR